MVYFAKHSMCTWKHYVPCHGCGKYSVNVDLVKSVHSIHSKFTCVCGGFLPMLQVTGRSAELFTPVCFPTSSCSLSSLCLLCFEPLLLGVHISGFLVSSWRTDSLIRTWWPSLSLVKASSLWNIYYCKTKHSSSLWHMWWSRCLWGIDHALDISVPFKIKANPWGLTETEFDRLLITKNNHNR